VPRQSQKKGDRANGDPPVVGDFSLPSDWLWVRLGDIAEVVMGNSPPSSSYNTAGRGHPLINGPTEFGPGALDHPLAIQFTDAPTKFCEPGDLLVCVRGSTTGRTNVASFQACIGRGIAAIRAGDCQPYINHYVASRASLLLAIGTGSTFPNVTLEQLRTLAVPLPPLAEQGRIVAAIEKSLAEMDAGFAALKRAQTDLVQLRASVLQAAVKGELTSKVRATKHVKEDGSALLRRVLAERQRRAEAAQLGTRVVQTSLFQAANSRYQEPPGPDVESLDPLPAGWVWATFGQLCEVQLGRAKNPSNRAGRYATPYLRAANITEEGLKLSDVLEMDFPPRERETYRLHKGDLVVSEASGSPDQVGKPAVWNDELPLCCFQNTVIRLRPVILDGKYVLVLLQHCYFNRVFASLSAGVGINHLGAGRLSQIAVPLPPEWEQKAIVLEVGEQLAAARASRTTIDDNLARSKQLRESVLARAFSGELVEPQSTEEPASALFERLRAQREKKGAERPPRVLPKRVNRMTSLPKRRPLLDVLREHPAGVTPEELFAEANYTGEAVDEFYAELSRIADSFNEEKPSGADALRWPEGARVLLRPKAR